jgi:hypothetical protein
MGAGIVKEEGEGSVSLQQLASALSLAASICWTSSKMAARLDMGERSGLSSALNISTGMQRFVNSCGCRFRLERKRGADS